MEENWIETVGGLKQMGDDEWKALSIPMGLVMQIKKNLTSPLAVENVEMQIDSGKSKSEDKQMQIEEPTAKILYKPVLKLDEKNVCDMYKE